MEGGSLMSKPMHELMTVLAAAGFLTMALSACGGGGGGGLPRTPVIGIGLPLGHGLGAGVITVAAGTSDTHGNVVVACPPGGSACVLTVSAEGTAVYDRTGGRPTVMLAYDSGGLRPGHGPNFMFAHRTYERDNPSAEDLLDHWNQPEPLRAALGLSAVDAADVADRTRDLANLINMAGGDPAETGTRLRDVRPKDVEIIGERDGITYGRWTGGPAGTLNIEFDWRFAQNFDAATRAGMERAGKSWSWRILDDFGTHVVDRGTEISYNDRTGSVTIDEDVPVDGVLIFMIDGGDASTSSAGPRPPERMDDDYQPWLGILRLSRRHVDLTDVMAHEVGHVIGLIGVSDWDVQPLTRYINRADNTFEGPEAMRANGGAAVPFQWLNEENRPVAPHTPHAKIDYGHLGVCTSIMAYCRKRTEVYLPAPLDFAYLDDIGYEILDAATASEPELYGYGAWGVYSAWGAGVERTIRFPSRNAGDARDTLRAGADAFGMAPDASLGETHAAVQGVVTWSGSLIGVDLGQRMLPPVFGDAELRVELSTLQGTALFDDLTVHIDGESNAFRAPRLAYDIGVSGNSFSDSNGHVQGGFFGPAHQEMAGVLDDRTATVNLLAGFGGNR